MRSKGLGPKDKRNLQEGDVALQISTKGSKGAQRTGVGKAHHVGIIVQGANGLELAESTGSADPTKALATNGGAKYTPLEKSWVFKPDTEVYSSPVSGSTMTQENSKVPEQISGGVGSGETGSSGSMQSQLADTSATQNPMTSGGQIQDTAQAGMNAQASAYYSSSSGATGNVNVTNVGGASSSSDKSGPLMTTPIDPMGWAVLQGTTVH